MTYWSTRLLRFIDQENEIKWNRDFVQAFLLYFEKPQTLYWFFNSD